MLGGVPARDNPNFQFLESLLKAIVFLLGYHTLANTVYLFEKPAS